jgi:hypothetical protein
MTPGMKKALMKSASGGCECGECGQHTGKYSGRYPKVCPNCSSPYKKLYDLEETTLLQNINTLIEEADIYALKQRHAQQDNHLMQTQAAKDRADEIRQRTKRSNLDYKQNAQLRTAREKARNKLTMTTATNGMTGR